MRKGGTQVGKALSNTDVVFVAAHPRVKDASKDVVFEVRVLETGEAAGVAFTSTKLLVEALGQSQPWVAMPLGRFRHLMGRAGVEHIVVNPKMPHDALRWQPRDLEDFVAGGRA